MFYVSEDFVSILSIVLACRYPQYQDKSRPFYVLIRQ